MRRALTLAGGIALAGMVGVGGWWLWRAERDGVIEMPLIRIQKPVPDAARYEVLVEELGRWRGELSEKYKKAAGKEAKVEIERDARTILELVLPEMMRCWLGTPYDYEGTAEKPGGGVVACGYFVSTVLRDAGFRVNRYKLAQQPSENIMRTFLPAKKCELRVGMEYERYMEWVEGHEEGIYLIGLDTHVGFIVNRPGGMGFFHSSAIRGVGVVEESSAGAGALRRSRWRMLGGLSGEPEVIRKWLEGDKIPVRK